MTKRYQNRTTIHGLFAAVLLVLPCCKDAERAGEKVVATDGKASVTGSDHNSQAKTSDREIVGSQIKQQKDGAQDLAPRPGGLLSSYKAGGIEQMQQQIDSMGPGLNRRKAIESLLIDASNLGKELKESEFAEIIKFIDQLPYAEDNEGFTGPFFGNIVGSQSSNTVVELVNSIDSKGLKGSLALALGKAQAHSINSEVKSISESIEGPAKTTFLCAWADQIESKVGPSDFDVLLRKVGLSEQDESMVIDAYLTSLTSKSGEELVQESKSLQNPEFSEKLLISGYKRWLREDSIKASSEFANRSSNLSPVAHDEIVEALVMQMQTQGDSESAKQWSETIKDNDSRNRLSLLLKQIEIQSKNE